MTKPLIRLGRWWNGDADRELFITANLMDLVPTSRDADQIILKQANYQRPWRIVGQTGAIGVPQGYGKFADVTRLMGIDGAANLVVVTTEQHDLAFQILMNDRLQEHFRQVNMPISYVRAKSSILQSVEGQLDIVITVLILMALLVGTVGGLGLASTMGLNVLERTREIGILRSLGAQTHVVRYMVIAEGELASIFSFLIAILFSIPFSLVMGNAIGQQILMRPLDYVFSWLGALIWFCLVLIIALLASFLPAESAARLTIRETLAYAG